MGNKNQLFTHKRELKISTRWATSIWSMFTPKGTCSEISHLVFGPLPQTSKELVYRCTMKNKQTIVLCQRWWNRRATKSGSAAKQIYFFLKKKQVFNSLRSEHRDCETRSNRLPNRAASTLCRSEFLIELILAINTGSSENTQLVGP